ncbi:MAG: hypothetical protein MJY59_00420 [Bacteroidaceae bacterium]|nr:hypothetical protein [Bacteroidaceae bacterium]
MKKIHRILLAVAVLTFSVQNAKAQDIMVNVSAKSNILPPQLLLYVSDPSEFFNVQLVNTTSEEQRVYLSLCMTHTMPDDGLLAATPDRYQPARPFVVPSNGVYSLTLNDMKNLFNHIPSSAMKIPDGLIEGYANGSFGLLPEGEYMIKFAAFRWTGNNQDSPYLLSSPTSGQCMFTVCYNAQAPTWIQPLVMFGNESEPMEIDPKAPLFTWSSPSLTCNPAQQYTYAIRIAEKLDFQSPDVAISEGNTVYFKDGLLMPSVTIPANVIKEFSASKTYVAQITAKALNSSKMNYVQIANNGKSSLCCFRVKESVPGFDFNISMGEGDLGEKDKIQYSFLNPDIKAPYFDNGTARKVYQMLDIDVEWEPAWLEEGYGDPKTLDIGYTVELYNGKDTPNAKDILDKKNLIYSKALPEDSTAHSIAWDSIASKVKANDHLVLRVQPVCKTSVDSIIFKNDSLNVRDFSMREFIGADYFRCSNDKAVENTIPTTKKKEDFKGKTVAIGKYQMLIDSISSGTGKDGFTGTGKVGWTLEKMGLGVINVHVRFEKLKINTDDVVYDGIAKGMEDPKAGDKLAAVNSLFSDIGLNDLLADAGVPYAEDITTGTKKSIADKVDGIADYYQMLAMGKSIWDLIKSGHTDIYMPLCMPKGVESLVGELPVDIQITKMEFASTYATMDLLGEFTMPESENLASDILVFGAPRLCISPDHILPESGQLALLDKFTVVEPSSGYECTFKAPQDLLEPTDGTYVSWKNYEFEVMGIDVDMKIPKLKKYDMDTKEVTDSLPTLTIRTQIASWDEFMVDEVSMEPFEIASLPGFTFVVDKMCYDHSRVMNASPMSGFRWPKNYKKEESIGKENLGRYGDNGWEGFYIKTMSVLLPEGLTSTADDSKDRLAITAKDFLIDKSGVTLNAKFDNVFDAYAGGFGVSVKEVSLNVVQNNFDNCYLKGDLGVPLLKDKDNGKARLDYECQVRRQIDEKEKETDNFAFIFNTRQLSGDFNLDLYAARLVLDANQTYFLLESEPKDPKQKKSETNKMVTRCELMLGGRMEIGRKSEAEDYLEEKLGTKLALPDIHFIGMRIANCKTWKSKYVDFQANTDSLRKVQEDKAIASLYTSGKEFTNGAENKADTTFYFHTGSWSLASASKKLGPFEFSLVNYDFTSVTKDESLVIGLGLCGRVNVVSGIELGAEAGVTIFGSIKNLSLSDLSNIECSLDSARLDSIALDASFSGITFDGHLYMSNDAKSEKGKGFEATLDVTLPGNLMSLHASGAYYDIDSDEDDYTWGYLNLKIGTKIELGPLVITKLGGGFYFNCSPVGKNKDGNFVLADIRNKKGLIGMSVSMEMASPDEKAATGELELAVVYNKTQKCLSQFIFTGNVKAVGGLINADMSLVYECTPMEKYLQLNITADAKIDYDASDYIGDFASDLGSTKEQLDEISGGKFNIITGCETGLDSKIGAKAEEPKKDEAPKNEPKENDAKSAAKTEDQKKMAATCSATVTLDVKVTWRTGGVDYPSPRWHFYLGEPAEDKRCSVVLIDFGKEGDLVNCKLGANCYLCFGNELPDNGQLPPIPKKISDFLDGAEHGDGYISDNLSQATEARNAALNSFKTDFGVLLGAQAYGNLGINLGLIYGKIEAIAGFDASLTHYGKALCTNFGRSPGYNGWYARGQLYAYMGMELGAKFDLGFVNYDIPLVKAGVGGVLKMGGPRPTYFQGKVRAKLNLLGGLFQIDKSYTFDVGEQCVLFQGNALDDFMLFSDCTLGDTIKENGWASDEKSIDGGAKMLNRNVRTPQYVDTEAPLEEHFRVIDNNELERIANNAGIMPGSKEHQKLYMQACRTFRFTTDNQYAVLYEYNDPEDDTWPKKVKRDGVVGYGESRKTVIPFDANSTGTRHFLNLPALRSALHDGKFYRLVLTGKAQELHDGVYKDPYTCDTITNDCDYRPWNRTVCYYFRTENSNTLNDKIPLSDYVAVAYPSNQNMLTNENIKEDSESGLSEHMIAYLGDVQRPTIALNDDIRDMAFKEGSLYWRLLNPMGKQIDIARNAFVEYKDGGDIVGLNMEPEHPLNARPNQKYIIELDYFTKETKVNESGSNVSQLVDTCLLRLFVETTGADKDWRTNTGISKRDVTYDEPFVACRLVDYEMEQMSPLPTEVALMGTGKYTYDPFWYVGYFSNYVFPAGWNVTESGFFNLEVTTSESLIFQHGGRKYEGLYDDKMANPQKAASEYGDIRGMLFRTVGKPYENWNQPSDKWMTNGSADYVYSGPTTYQYRRTSTFNSKDISHNVWDIISTIRSVYQDVEAFNREIIEAAQWVSSRYDSWSSDHWAKDYIRNLVAAHRGEYITEDGIGTSGKDYKSYASDGKVIGKDGSYAYNNATISVPYYMLPTIFSIATFEKASDAFKGFNNDSPRAQNAKTIWNHIDKTPRFFDAKGALKHINKLTAVCYRINAYDFVNGHYGVTDRLLNGMAVFQADINDPFGDKTSSDVTASGGCNTGNTSDGETKDTEPSGIDKTTADGESFNYDRMEMLAKRVTDYSGALTNRLKEVKDPSWNEYVKNLKELKSTSAEALSYAKKTLGYYCEHRNDKTSAKTKTNAEQAVRRAYELFDKTRSSSDDLKWGLYYKYGDLVNGKQEYENHRGGFHDLLCDAWDELRMMSDQKSKEYKRYETLYNDGHEAYMNLDSWCDSIDNSCDSGEAYQARQMTELAEYYLSLDENVGYCDELADEARDMARKAAVMQKNVQDYHTNYVNKLQTVTGVIEELEKMIDKNELPEDEQVINDYLDELDRKLIEARDISGVFDGYDFYYDKLDSIGTKIMDIRQSVLELLIIDDSPQYKTVNNAWDATNKAMQLIHDDSLEMRQLWTVKSFSKIPERIENCKYQLESFLDQYQNRDWDTANAMVARIDSINELRNDVWNGFLNGPDGMKGVDDMYALYESIVRDRMNYHSGDMDALRNCADNCALFTNRITEMRSAYEYAVKEFRSISGTDCLERILQAGFRKTSPLYVTAKDKNNQAASLNNREIMTELDNLESIRSGKGGAWFVGNDVRFFALADTKFRGKEDLARWWMPTDEILAETENPERFYADAGMKTLEDMSAMYYAARKESKTEINTIAGEVTAGMSVPTDRLKSYEEEILKYIREYRDGAVRDWSVNDTWYGPKYFLDHVVDAANEYCGIYEELSDRLRTVNRLAEMVADSLDKAEAIRNRVPDVANPYAGILLRRYNAVREYYTGTPFNQIEGIATKAREISHTWNDVLLPIRTEAIEALNYIAEHGQPFISPDDSIARARFLEEYHALGRFRETIENLFVEKDGKKVYHGRDTYVERVKSNHKTLTETWMPTLRDNNSQLTALSEPDPAASDIDRDIQIFSHSKTFMDTFTVMRDSTRRVVGIFPIMVDELGGAREAYANLQGKLDDALLTEYAAMIKQIEDAATVVSEYMPEINNMYEEANSMPYMAINQSMKNSKSRIKNYVMNYYNENVSEVNALFYDCQSKYNTMQSKWDAAETVYEECANTVAQGKRPKASLLQTGIDAYNYISSQYPVFGNAHSRMFLIVNGMTSVKQSAIAAGIDESEFVGLGEGRVNDFRSRLADFRNDIKPKRDAAVKKGRELEDWKE